jgi:hypothetical protein
MLSKIGTFFDRAALCSRGSLPPKTSEPPAESKDRLGKLNISTMSMLNRPRRRAVFRLELLLVALGCCPSSTQRYPKKKTIRCFSADQGIHCAKVSPPAPTLRGLGGACAMAAPVPAMSPHGTCGCSTGLVQQKGLQTGGRPANRLGASKAAAEAANATGGSSKAQAEAAGAAAESGCWCCCCGGWRVG